MDVFISILRSPHGMICRWNGENALAGGGLQMVADGDSLDWKDYDAKAIFKRVTEHLQPGSIVLFHNAALHTPEALPSIWSSCSKTAIPWCLSGS